MSNSLISGIPKFYHPYIIPLIGESDIIEYLERQNIEMSTFFLSLPSDLGNFAYAEGKWTIKELIQHITDAERIFSTRFLRILRSDPTPNPGFDEDHYAKFMNVGNDSIKQLLEEFTHLRAANLSLFHRMKLNDFDKEGIVNGFSLSLKSLLYIMAGHPRHHLNVIKERYLAS